MEQDQPQPAYRWVVLGASSLILAVAMGAMVNGISAFIVPMNLSYGWDRGDVSAINFSGIMGLAFGSFLVGRLADRIGTRTVVLAGSVVLALCYAVAALVSQLWQFYLLFFVAGFFGAGAINPPVIAAVGGWFKRGAGLAIGIVSAGQALGQGGVPYLSTHLINTLGVQGAFSGIALIMAATLVPLALLLRDPPVLPANERAAQAIEEGLRIPPAMLTTRMCLAIILCCTCMSVPLIHLVPLVQDCGFPLEQAGGVGFAMLISAIGGRVAFGKLADIFGAIPAYMSATAWMTVMVFWFIYLGELNTFYIYAVVYGFGYGGVMTGVLTTMREHSPPSRRASMLGIVLMFGWFGHAIGGYQGGLFYDLTGDYMTSYAIAAISGMVNLLVVGTLLFRSKRPPGLAVQV